MISGWFLASEFAFPVVVVFLVSEGVVCQLCVAISPQMYKLLYMYASALLPTTPKATL